MHGRQRTIGSQQAGPCGLSDHVMLRSMRTHSVIVHMFSATHVSEHSDRRQDDRVSTSVLPSAIYNLRHRSGSASSIRSFPASISSLDRSVSELSPTCILTTVSVHVLGHVTARLSVLRRATCRHVRGCRGHKSVLQPQSQHQQ